MPTYCFKTTDGSVKIERKYPMGKAPKTFTTGDGVQFVRDFQAEMCPNSFGSQRIGVNVWPMECAALGVGIHQVPEANKHAAENGLPVRYNPVTGDARFESRSDRRKVMEHFGAYDKDAGYGDRTKGG